MLYVLLTVVFIIIKLVCIYRK